MVVDAGEIAIIPGTTARRGNAVAAEVTRRNSLRRPNPPPHVGGYAAARVALGKGLNGIVRSNYALRMNSLFKFLLCAALLGLVGCNKKDSVTDKTGKAYTIAVIPKGTTHEFWKAIHAGAMKAGEEIKGKGVNVEIIWKGPFREDDRDQQIQVVENFTSKRVSGI